MGLFKRKKDNVLDLTKRYRKQQEKIKEIKSETQNSQASSENNSGGFGFFGAIANTVSKDSSQKSSDYVNIGNNTEEKKQKLSKRLVDMTEKIEEASNQIYHLQQRIEVLERKLDVNRF
jgi:peptidoglycan hydrolase CwlO-like protein